MYWRRHQLLLCFIIADKLCFRNKFAVQGARRADQRDGKPNPGCQDDTPSWGSWACSSVSWKAAASPWLSAIALAPPTLPDKGFKGIPSICCTIDFSTKKARCREVGGVSPGKGAGKREALASWQRWSTTGKWLAFPWKTVTLAVQHSQNSCQNQGRFWQKRWKIVLTRQLFPPWQRNLSILHPVTTFKDLLCGTWNLDVKQAILGLDQAWTSTFNLKFIFAITS